MSEGFTRREMIGASAVALTLAGTSGGAAQAEPQPQDLPLALVQRAEQAGNLVRQQRGGGHLEGGLSRAVLDHITQLGVAVLPQGFGQ